MNVLNNPRQIDKDLIKLSVITLLAVFGLGVFFAYVLPYLVQIITNKTYRGYYPEQNLRITGNLLNLCYYFLPHILGLVIWFAINLIKRVSNFFARLKITTFLFSFGIFGTVGAAAHVIAINSFEFMDFLFWESKWSYLTSWLILFLMYDFIFALSLPLLLISIFSQKEKIQKLAVYYGRVLCIIGCMNFMPLSFYIVNAITAVFSLPV